MPAVEGDFLDLRKGEIRSHDLASMSEGTMKVSSLRIQYLLSMIFSFFRDLMDAQQRTIVRSRERLHGRRIYVSLVA